MIGSHEENRFNRGGRPNPASAGNARRTTKPRAGASASELIRELPHIGTIRRTEEGRGFGYLVGEPGGEEVFFHVNGHALRGRERGVLPAPGTRVLFILGSDPRHTLRKRAIRWVPVPLIPQLVAAKSTTQAELDELRRAALKALEWDSLWQLLRADWYGREWGNNPPADLVDHVLEEVWKARVPSLPAAELTCERFWAQAAKTRYKFSAQLAPADLCRVFDLTSFDLPQLLALGSPRAEWVPEADRKLRFRLMEWYLASRQSPRSAEDWSAWFTGTCSFEADLACHVIKGASEVDPFVSGWLHRLAENKLLDTANLDAWAERCPQAAVDFFERLSSVAQLRHLRRWQETPEALLSLKPSSARSLAILSSTALSIDLETDGERVWEVGCAQGGSTTMLFTEGSACTLSDALTQVLSRSAAASLTVGHNLTAWDWPIIKRLTGSQQETPIWDTLLTEFLLKPQAASHALDGSHKADGDALAALEMFRRQLAQFPPEFALRILLAPPSDGARLIEKMASHLDGAVHYSREEPAAMASAGDRSRIMLVSQERIREYDWVPDVSVVSVDPAAGLPLGFCRIDSDKLEEQLGVCGTPSPAGMAVLAVARFAAKQRISIRRNMIPLWLTDGDEALSQALDRSCVSLPNEGGFRIAPLPSDLEWWRTADITQYQLQESQSAILLRECRPTRLEAPENTSRDWSATSLQMVAIAGEATHWIVPDRAAHILEPHGGTVSFATWSIGVRQHRTSPPQIESRSLDAVLATRRNHVLYPHSYDQASYWKEVLRTLREVAAANPGKTPVLLVESSKSLELVRSLETGLCEIGLGEVRPTHRSKREHLRRACKQGFAVVDLLANWPKWRSLAQSLSVPLQPVLEALPIEEWYALQQAERVRTPTELPGDAIDPAVDSRADAELPLSVSFASILEELPALLFGRLPTWLTSIGISPDELHPVLIDSRLSQSAHRLRGKIGHLALSEAPLAAAEVAALDIALASFKLEREEAPSDFSSMERFLIQHWQPDSTKSGQPSPGFKASQRPPMEAICDRSSHVLVSLPTGEGKSVLFQVPALCRGLRNRRLTLVISPLKALMRDQLEGLRQRGFGVSADYISGDLTPHEAAEVMQGVLDHRIVLLYVSPERLRSPIFLAVLEKRMEADAGLEYVVIDEAHCVNQWGYEFRPDYFHATQLLLRKCREWPGASPTPFLLMSATITAADKERLSAFLESNAESGHPTLKLLARPDSFANPIRSHIEIQPKRCAESAGGDESEAALDSRVPVISAAIRSASSNQERTKQRSAGIVFVQSRSLAQRLAERLSEDTGARVAFYHAGLDSATREEVYSDFRQEELDVLVATKAFGMGMHIPDIHWAVHFSPSGTLEDYLQEVGRIGRGATERKKAGLKTLSALLPYSNQDFARIRDLRAANALSRPAVESLFTHIRGRAVESEGQLVAIVPEHGYNKVENDVQLRAAKTRTRMALYWLERAGELKLCSSLPDALTVSLRPDVLASLEREQGPVGELASILLHLEGVGDALKFEAADQKGWLKRILQNLADKVGFAFTGSSKRQDGSRNNSQTSTFVEAVLNLSQIRLHSKTMKSNDDVLACLADLDKRGGIRLNRQIEFSKRKLASNPDESITTLFELVGSAAAEVIRRLAADGTLQFDPLQLVEEGALAEVAKPSVDADVSGRRASSNGRQQELFSSAYINGLRSLLRASGLKLRQVINEDETVRWEAMLARSKCRDASARQKALLKSAQALLSVLNKAPEDRIDLSSLVNKMREVSLNRRFSELDLKRTAGLLSALKLISMSIDLMQVSHVVVLSSEEGDNSKQADVWTELAEVNELGEVRSLAMEVFANLKVDAQEAFIAGYFAQSNAKQLRQFLETQIGEIEIVDDGQGSTIIEQMQEQLRATRVVELFEKFQNSEEPSQWEAVRHPYDQHLLVNAGPGAGKTFVLVGRIVHLIREQHIHPSQIVVLAFNRAVVFEIRRRVRELFKSLGYASYASRLRVSTIHSFAMRHLAEAGETDRRRDLKDVLSRFAARMKDDQNFRRKVAGDVRCILVDEYQDVTEDIYTVLKNLHLGSEARAGVMVIGDDDQDILRWQRESGEFSESYFDRFVDDFGGSELKQLVLAVNFRSSKDIVARSQKVISAFFSNNERSRRLKTSLLAAQSGASFESRGERLDWKGRIFEDAVREVPTIWQKLSERHGGNLAILCRSNAEVAHAHQLLQSRMPDLTVQGAADLRTADLRHQALWLDFLRSTLDESDRALSENLQKQLLSRFKQEVDIPEVRDRDESVDSITSLWELCIQEKAYPHVSSLIRFTEDLRTDELLRLSGVRGTAGSNAVISTIHKVKGLEFDNVVILPSRIPFGTRGRSAAAKDIVGDAAEEARLLYVGMTRAKQGLWYFVGERELSWGQRPPRAFSAEQRQGLVLEGSPEEVSLGWAGQSNYFNPDPADCQAYIEREVRVGDPVLIGGRGAGAGKGLFHRDPNGRTRQIGYLAKSSGFGSPDADLKVSAVIRFYPEELTAEAASAGHEQRRWAYAVLVSGRLR
ncbi:superfamily I DNA/RNA helicase/superfamily II DNA/RNA helicase [Sphingomonas kaistensis]|uniref:DNA 3'-5' helicase n=1 Tax=Sphingomonas kaistensis TaxID=298708 RepID=A0A7X5Y5W2_9SPHN|nr:superfamily I DNA/RNA helicase/superfamily II DNA/RNA helicase [Sphingomonas kaistensis]